MGNDKIWTRAEVQLIDENEFPKNIYEVQSPRQLERWLKDVILDAYNESTAKAVGRIVSMVERNKDESLSVAREVDDYIMTTTGGWFSLDEVCRRLQLTTAKDRKNVVVCLLREKDKGIIIPSPYKDAKYRRVMAESEVLDWKNAVMNPIDIKWPFKLEELVDIYPTNIIVVAGAKDAGKTTFMFNLIKLNMDSHKIHYHTSEMAEQELKLRLSKFDTVDTNDWNFTPYLRSSNFVDAVIGKENDFIIFDFLEWHDQFWKIGDVLKEIHSKLRKGVCVVAIQKSTYKELGRGADYALEKARLYLTMQSGKVKIISGKNWHGTRNPSGLVHEFKIVSGAKIIPQGVWYEEGEDPLEKKGRFK